MTTSNLSIFILTLTIAFFGISIWARKSENPRIKLIINIMRVLIFILVLFYLTKRQTELF